jgi:ankyrin repeat protein
MAARNGLLADLDALFEQAKTVHSVKEALDTFFKNTDPRFYTIANGTPRYGYHFKDLLYSDDVDSFDEFMNTFNLSPNTIFTLEIKDPISDRYAKITAPLLCFVTGIGGVFNKDIADYLLERGASVYAGYTHPDLDHRMLNPLLSAAYYGSIDAVKYLIENTEIKPTDKMNGLSALSYIEMRITDIERRLEELDDAMAAANTRGERNHLQGRIEDLQLIRREYVKVTQYLRSVTPRQPELENRNLRRAEAQLRPNLKTAIEALSVKGTPRKNNKTQKIYIPRNVMGYLGQMLPPKRRFQVKPINTGLKHVQTNLFTNSPAPVAVNQNTINEPTNLGRIKSNLLRNTRRIKKARKARKGRKTRRS